ncbi:MAG TPA: alpha/beta fold hydrolase [Hyphomonadaceae bacterium]|nr:alpha/beta fold hydrolase [Hyphomonadaceae bacterium]
MSNRLAPLFGVLMLCLSACAPVMQQAMTVGRVTPATGFSDNWFTSYDGARLGLSVWKPTAEPSKSEPSFGPNADADCPALTNDAVVLCDLVSVPAKPQVVIIAVHGMNDYAGAFKAAGKYWSDHGAVVYAYDQRSFGRSPGWMIWPDPEVMRKDLATAVQIARRMHPNAKIAVVGESMGASVAITAFAERPPPGADALILSGPGLYGWGVLPWTYSVSLWASAHVRPGWIVVPPKEVHITATDNNEKLREMWFDPNVQKTNRIDSVYGVVSIMEDADAKISQLPPSVPTLLLYGAHDQVIPPEGVERAARKLPPHVRTAYYAKGYHMLMNDLQAETVWKDVLAFVEDPKAPLPSKAPPLPWKRAAAS